MKNLAFVCLFIVCLLSCVTEKSFYRDFNKEALVGKVPNEKVFVIKKNGEKISGEKLTYSKYSIWRVQQKEDWIAVDGKKVNNEDIQAIQTNDEFKKFYKDSKNMVRSVTRLRFGKINLYTYVDVSYSGNIKDYYHLYVFEKGDDILRPLYFESFANAISDNPDVLQKFKQLFPKSKVLASDEKGNLKGLITVVDLYNSQN